MSVPQGRYGRVTVRTTGGNVTVSEMGSWSITGQNRDMIEHTAFGDSVKEFKPGMLDAGSIQIAGFYDPRDSSGQTKLISAFSSGVSISNSSLKKLRKLRVWANKSTGTTCYGHWSCVGSSGELWITSFETGTDKSGLANFSMTLKVSRGILAWSTTT